MVCHRWFATAISNRVSNRACLIILLGANVFALTVVLHKGRTQKESSVEEHTSKTRQVTVDVSEGKTTPPPPNPDMKCDIASPLKGLLEVHLAQGRRENVDLAWAVYKSMSLSSLKKVKTFVLVTGLGGPLAGLVGSLLNAHPHAILAHQPDLLLALSHEADSEKGFTETARLALYNQIAKSAFKRAHSVIKLQENGGVTSDHSSPDWRYSIFPGLYAGVHTSQIDFIGLDVSNSLVQVGRQSVDEVDFLLKRLFALSKVPVTVLIEIENPFDAIALQSCRIQEAATAGDSTSSLEKATSVATREYFSSMDMLQHIQLLHSYIKFVPVHLNDLHRNPVVLLESVCHQIGLSCSNLYVYRSTNMILPPEKLPKFRNRIRWSRDEIQEIERGISEFSVLKGYSLTGDGRGSERSEDEEGEEVQLVDD